jgi:hypothetical protein
VGDRQDNAGDRRSGPALDDVAQGREFVDVERRGLLAADELVDRLVRAVDGDHDERAGQPRAESGGPSPRRAAPALLRLGGAEDLMRVWVQFLRVGLDAFADLLPSEGADGPDDCAHAALVDTRGVATGMVRISVARADSASADGTDPPRAEVWLHNGSRAPGPAVALHCGDLRAADGAVLPAASVRFDPPLVDLPARSSRGVGVSVDDDASPGTYRGVVLATGIPDAWLPIEVVIAAHPPGD